MSDNELAGATALVTGASRGFGRGIATALSAAGAQVVGVARDRAALEEVRAALGESFTPVTADAADPIAGDPDDPRASRAQSGGDAPAEAPAGTGDQRRPAC